METTFNLIHEPWIPCVDLQGRPALLGLQDILLRAHELGGVAGDTPPVTAALHRLLLAILHRNFGPANRRAWGRLWEAGRWPEEPLKAYFEKWEERFDLFHPERPFYQFDDPLVNPKSIVRMMLHFALTPTLFDHNTEESGMSLSPAEAAQALVTAQAFSVGGICDPSQNMYFTQGTGIGGVLFLMEGDSLFSTLALNLIRYPDPEYLPILEADLPAWEQNNPFEPERTKPYGYLDYLTWLNRRILLVPEEENGEVVVRTMKWSPGLAPSGEIHDFMKHYTVDKKGGARPMIFNEEKAVWRDSSALLHIHQHPSDRPPLNLVWLARLVQDGYLDASATFRYSALGVSSYQAKVFFYRQERLPLPLAYLQDPELVGYLDTAIQLAQDTGRKLWGALIWLAHLKLDPGADQGENRKQTPPEAASLVAHWGAERYFWAELELPFIHLITDLPEQREAALERWREILRKITGAAYEQAVELAGTDVRALKAGVKGRLRLRSGLKEVLPVTKKESVHP